MVEQDIARQSEYANRWLQASDDVKNTVKQESLRTLGSPTKAHGYAATVVAAIAAVELPVGQWQDLIQILLGFVNNQENVNLRMSTLQTIGFICESIVRGLHRLLA